MQGQNIKSICIFLWAITLTTTLAHAAGFSAAPNLGQPRLYHTATLLSNGKVLVTGGSGAAGLLLASSELYDPSSNSWTAAGSLHLARRQHTATLLANGKVLVTGGFNTNFGIAGTLNSTEIYDPATDTWTVVAPMLAVREFHTSTLLNNGNVLVVGGASSLSPSVVYAGAEIYDPVANTWTATGDMNLKRDFHTATLMPNGTLIVVGGHSSAGSGPAVSVEYYDPVTNVWTGLAGLTKRRRAHSAILLNSGQLLVAGGGELVNGTALKSTEIYDPINNEWNAGPNLAVARDSSCVALLPNGQVLNTGGESNGGFTDGVATAELYDPTTNMWTNPGPTVSGRFGHTSTLLTNGKVLLAGGRLKNVPPAYCETYDYAAYSWTSTLVLSTPRSGHSATLLPTGNVLCVGGSNGTSTIGTCDLYNPTSNTWANAANDLVPRTNHSATLLLTGKVLVVGGSPGLDSTELYDPVADAWASIGSLKVGRNSHTATALANGKILIVGGQNGGTDLATAELFDPLTNQFSTAGTMTTPRSSHTATLLSSGKVLVVAGTSNGVCQTTCELYDPVANTWGSGGALTSARAQHAASILSNGQVMVSGGINGTAMSSVEIYNPTNNGWIAVASMLNARYAFTTTVLPTGKILAAGSVIAHEVYDSATNTWVATATASAARQSHRATLMPNEKVLLTGGTEGANVLNTAEFTDDGLQYQANLQPQILTVGTPLVLNAGLALTGTQFKGITEATGGLSTMSATNYPVAFLRALDSERVIALLSDPAVPWSATTYKSAAIAAEFPRGYVMASVITNGISSPAVLVPSLLDTTTTAAAATVAYSPAAQNVTLNATVASSGGTVGEGNVTFHVKNGATLIGTAVQSTTVSNGVASVIYALPAGTTSGTYTIVATYGNAINFASSSDTTKALTISPYVTTTLSSNQTVPYSSAAQNVTLNALVTSSVAVNQGTVTFQLMNGATNVGVATVSTQVVEGAASVSYVLPAGTPVGTYTLIATYGNGTNFATSTDHVHLLTITPAATTTTASNQTCVYSSASQNVTLSATVNANGSTVNEGTVTFQLMNGATNVGVAVTSGTVSSGSASVSYALVAGTQVGAYTISAIYTPGSNFVGSSDNSKSLNVTYLSITIASNPTATPNPVLVNQSVSFSGAASGGTNALVYSWNFGDGTSASGASVSHVYSPAGTYSAVLSVTDGVTTEHSDISVLVNPLVSVIGSDVDSDGDGFSDSFENFVGTDPSNTASAPATGLIGALGLGKATIKLNFAKSVGDNIALNGTLNVPQGFNATGAVVYFDAGGIYKKLTLDRNGSAKSGNDSFKIALKSKNGIVQENPVAAFSATFMKGNFANALATVSQLNNANLTNVMRTVTFAVIFNNSALLKNQSMIYTAKQNKTGSAK